MELIDRNSFERDLIHDLENDVNMYDNIHAKDIRDEKYYFAIDELKSRDTILNIQPEQVTINFIKDILKDLECPIQAVPAVAGNYQCGYMAAIRDVADKIRKHLDKISEK